MKRLTLCLLALLCLLPLAAQTQPAPAPTPDAAPSKADASYALGMLIASQIKSANLEVSYADFTAGMKDFLEGPATRLTQAQAQAAIQAAVAAAEAKQAQAALAEGKAYLDKNKVKGGVFVTASGLQYEILTKGSGSLPKATDTVTVNYEGRLIDGRVFDSSYERGEPVSFVLNQVIKGWTEGLQLMPVGSKFRFTIPSDLAYGSQGAGEDIPANAVLVFDVELLSIGTK